MMLRDSNRHLEEKIAALREENARLRAELYGKKSERTVARDLDITIEEVPAKEEPKPTATDGTQQNKTDKPAKRTRRLRVEIVPAHLALHIYRCPAFVRVGKRGRKKQEAPSAQQRLPPSFPAAIIALLLHNKYVLKLPLYRQLCRAHVRRNFVNCAKNSNDPQWSQEMVNLIRPIYRLEKELRQGAPPPEEIRKRRQEEAATQVKEIFSVMGKRLKATQNPPINALRRAIDYAMERREMPESWLYDPNIPIDNNTAERAARPVTIGRKNSLFIGAPEAGQRSAILYTMMEECKLCKVDSLAWLTWVLDRIPNYRGDYRDLYPSAMPQPQETVKERTI